MTNQASLKFDIIKVEAGDNALQNIIQRLPEESFTQIKNSQACLKVTCRRVCSRCNIGFKKVL